MNRLSLDADQVPEHIGGISCNAKNCVYNDGQEYCTAPRINIGPSYAVSSMETVCATFKPKSM